MLKKIVKYCTAIYVPYRFLNGVCSGDGGEIYLFVIMQMSLVDDLGTI